MIRTRPHPYHHLIFVAVALLLAFFITRSTVQQPGYTDAFYYYNAAGRLVNGAGLTDAYLWTYIGAPAAFDAGGVVPSHLYWMPFTSLVAAFGMWALNAPGDYAAAQWPFALMFAGASYVAFWLGGRLGKTPRHMWLAGLLTLFSGFFTRFWGMTDAFAPYALFGGAALLFMGLGLSSKAKYKAGFWLLAGICAGVGHLTRADGVLLLFVGGWLIGWQGLKNRRALLHLISALSLLVLGYLLVMTPWFLRNIDLIGTPLAVGGAQAIWYAEYNDLFKYPPGVSAQAFFADGLGLLFESRWVAFTNNLGTFVAVEGLVVITPLMLLALWRRRTQRFLWPFALYALGLHLAMTFVFPFPGYRGGLFHSVAALVPWWAALGAAGLDDAIEWVAQRRRTWRPAQAKWVFSIGLVMIAFMLSWHVSSGHQVRQGTPGLYTQLGTALPDDARIMINDPAQLYYHTRMGGVVIPSASPDVLLEIARRYEVGYLLVEIVNGVPAVPAAFLFDLDAPPDFLHPLDFSTPGVRLYEIRLDA